jgi:hypothetical protein
MAQQAIVTGKGQTSSKVERRSVIMSSDDMTAFHGSLSM